MKKFKVIIAEKMNDIGIELLKANCDVDVEIGISRENLLAKIHEYDALLVRSVTQVNAELMDMGKNLKIVGRAGNGTDNIDIPEATKRGIIVANTPDSNTISACEIAIGLMLDGARDISYADKHLKAGNWDRNRFEGTELFNKTLGIIGLGRIGGLMATRMKAFGMNLIAYDPYISDTRFKRYDCAKAETLDDLLKISDIITIHTPRTNETLNMIGDEEIEKMKDGVRLVNAARGSLMNEDAVYKGLKSGKIASFGIDVHATEPRTESPLYEFENVTVTPHIGANTKDAQYNVGKVIAEQIIAGLNGDIVTTAVNLPAINKEDMKVIKPYIDLMEKLGKIYYQLEKEKVKMIEISYWGEVSKQDTDMISLSFIKGLLSPIQDGRVNYINAKLIAEKSGIAIVENHYEENYNDFANLIKIDIVNDKNDTLSLKGVLASNKEGKLIEIDEFEVDVRPRNHILFVHNYDVPGVIGEVGTVVGKAGINIATMHVGKKSNENKALMLLNIDQSVSKEVLSELTANENILWAKSVEL
jgi:D-3-phosphoglycerate dehydrogenase